MNRAEQNIQAGKLICQFLVRGQNGTLTFK